MAADDLLNYWHTLQSHQSDWAYRAYGRLISSLSEDVQQKLSYKDHAAESYVVIFGKTQVGKTTLLLDLMGVALEHMATVSEVLRGGRKAGKSATATTMEYCRSADERWGLSINAKPQWFHTNEDITQHLGQLRADMEAGQLLTDSPCVVHIPQHFFAATHAAGPNVRMLDLPGDNPANAAEQQHVNEMAKTYMPFADLIILVGRGDDLGFLRPEAITLPGIEDWQKMPYRFRIVTTYSYTAQSVRDLIRADPQFDATQLRQRLVKQIELFGGLSEAAKEARLYFPLEFGSSWMNVKQKASALHSRMEPMIQALRTELLEHIADSTSPMGRLRNTLNTHLSIKTIQEEKIKVVEEALAALDKKGAALTENLKEYESEIQTSKGKAAALQDILKDNPFKDGMALIAKAKELPKFTSTDPYPGQVNGTKEDVEDVEDLKNLMYKFQRSLKTMRLDVTPLPSTAGSSAYWAKVKMRFVEPEISTIESILDDSFGSIRATLNEYWFDRYLSSSNFAIDLNSVRSAGEKAKEKILKQFKDGWIMAMVQVDKQIREKHYAAEFDQLIFTEERDKTLKLQNTIKQEKAQGQIEREKIYQNWEQDLERCDKFVHLLDEEYLAALNDKLNIAVPADDACDALLHIISFEEMRKQREDLMSMNAKKSR